MFRIWIRGYGDAKNCIKHFQVYFVSSKVNFCFHCGRHTEFRHFRNRHEKCVFKLNLQKPQKYNFRVVVSSKQALQNQIFCIFVWRIVLFYLNKGSVDDKVVFGRLKHNSTRLSFLRIFKYIQGFVSLQGQRNPDASF